LSIDNLTDFARYATEDGFEESTGKGRLDGGEEEGGKNWRLDKNWGVCALVGEPKNCGQKRGGATPLTADKEGNLRTIG